MVCCVLGVVVLAHAFAIWRWFSLHGRKLLLGVLLTVGVALTAGGAAELWLQQTAPRMGADLLDLCTSAAAAVSLPRPDSPTLPEWLKDER